MYGAVWKSYLVQIQGCQPYTSSNIENWWERGDRWRHKAQHMMSFVEKKNVRKRCCWNCNIWPNWFTSHQSNYCLYYNGIPEFVRKRSMSTVKQLKKNVQYLKFHCWIYKKWQTSAIIREISDSNLETARNGSKPGVCLLDYPGELTDLKIIRETRWETFTLWAEVTFSKGDLTCKKKPLLTTIQFSNMHVRNSSCDSQAKSIISRSVIKWHEFHRNKKISTTLIFCYARRT